MSINPFIYDMRRLKFDCIQAYFHSQLESAEEQSKEETSLVCVRDQNKVRNQLLEIIEIIENNNNTHENIKRRATLVPFLANYCNVTGDIVKKHFKSTVVIERESYPNLTDEEFEKETEKHKQGWIPSFLALEVFRQFSEKGYKDFEHIDFVQLQGEYEAFFIANKSDEEESLLKRHYKCAEEIVKSITKKKVFRKRRR